MRNRGVASRYAQALLDTSRKAGVLDGVAESYAAVVDLYAQRPDLASFLEGPQVADQEKEQLLDAVLGGRVKPVLLHFFHLLLKKGRIEHLLDIRIAFQELVEIHQGGTSAPPRHLTIYGPQGLYWGALVTLYTSQGGYPVAMDQGFTDRLGRIDIYGARPGDTLSATATRPYELPAAAKAASASEKIAPP